jgi:hypothetical protein
VTGVFLEETNTSSPPEDFSKFTLLQAYFQENCLESQGWTSGNRNIVFISLDTQKQLLSWVATHPYLLSPN